MKIIVVKRGAQVQLLGSIMVAGKTYLLAPFERVLQGGVKSREDASAAFMQALGDGKDLDAMFDALEDHPEIDPVKELAELIEEGKREMVARATDYFRKRASELPEAQSLLDAGITAEHEIAELADGEGICRTCHKRFELHYIAGTRDLCMSHINPGFI